MKQQCSAVSQQHYLEGLHVGQQAGALHARPQVSALRRRAQLGQHLRLLLQQVLGHGGWLLSQGTLRVTDSPSRRQ